MPGEKTEQPTAKRIREARKKGQVFKSPDITQALLFLTAAGILAGFGGVFVDQLRKLLTDFLQPATFSDAVGPALLLDRTGTAFARFLLLCAPMLVALAMVAAAAVFLQVQPLFSPEVVMPKLDKLNPLKGFQNIFFKSKTYIELLKNLAKFTIVLVLAGIVIRSSLRDAVMASRLSVESAGALAGGLVSSFLLRAGVVFLLIGAADFLLQKKLYMKSLMMSKEEVKQEYKQDEGDPHVKQMRKHLHEEALLGGATVKVPKADVVVINPTHLAIALKYDEKSMGAPEIVAKGREELAAKIREIAERHKVPILRNVPLAHSLYAVELGREIPEDLYEAVAEVLNWVFQLRQERES
ncbi:MAG: EscU/YscU/HrcU family type III secretion system export apparatus switch protein [Candidatus Solibacter sp.]|nr:EscU/YscU/HrcU family type III secretion system export apparatus switch protein [Candidatus Solibacter sp.]